MGTKIKQLHIDGLFGQTYNLSFHDDVTFLYGINGSGKTTILNILSYIISGNLIALHNYSFLRLILTCKTPSDELKELIVERSGDVSGPWYVVHFDGKTGHVPTVKHVEERTERGFLPDDDDDFELDTEVSAAVEDQFKEVRDLIRETFSLLYLPLNRRDSGMVESMMRGFRYARGESTLEASVRRAARLISSFAGRVTRHENDILENLKAEVLRQALRTPDLTPTDLNSVDQYLSEKHKEELNSAISGLRLPVDQDLGLLGERLLTLRPSFAVSDSGSLAINDALGFANYVSAASQLRRLHEIAASVTKANEQRRRIRRPLTTLLDVLNDFLKDSGKEVEIEENGRLAFGRPGTKQKISAYRLSSGEKQLLIFFVYVILGWRGSKSGVFIVDEPELSLHLAWQRRLVPSLMGVSPSVQLIFATHSPEIIGPMTEKCVEVRGVQ